MSALYDPATVRRATVADGEAIRAIRNAAVEESTAIWTGVQQTPDEARAWLSAHLERGSVFVAETDSTVAGFACWEPWRPKEGYRHTVGDSIYLADGHRGRGHGRALLEVLVASARASGAHVMVADIESGNEASIQLHRRLGFETVGQLSEVGTKFGRWLDLTIMQLMLAGRG